MVPNRFYLAIDLHRARPNSSILIIQNCFTITPFGYLVGCKRHRTRYTLIVFCVIMQGKKNSCCRKIMYEKLKLKHRLHFRFMQIWGTVYILATICRMVYLNCKKIGNPSGTFLRTTRVTVYMTAYFVTAFVLSRINIEKNQ